MPKQNRKFRFREDDAKEAGADGAEGAAKVEDAAANSTAAGSGGVDAQAAIDKHGDAAQDVELFKKLIGEYLGAEHVENTEAQAMAKDYMAANKEAGMSAEEAYKCAGYAMKASANRGAQESKKESAAKEAAAKEAAAKEAADKNKEGGTVAETTKSKEAAAKASGDLAKLAAENAKLKEELRKRDMDTHLETVLKESKLPRAATKVFRESVAPRLKTKEEIDKELKTFQEAYSESGSGRDDEELDGFGACVEKHNPNFNNTDSAETYEGFGDCTN